MTGVRADSLQKGGEAAQWYSPSLWHAWPMDTRACLVCRGHPGWRHLTTSFTPRVGPDVGRTLGGGFVEGRPTAAVGSWGRPGLMLAVGRREW